MRSLLILFLLCAMNAASQQIAVIGNQIPLLRQDSLWQINFYEQVPASLDTFKALMIFSTANSKLSSEDERRIEQFVTAGGNLYLGADNWPLMQESNQLTNRFYQATFYGCFRDQQLTRSNQSSLPESFDNAYAGETTSSFPLTFDLKVEAWTADNPIILSGMIGKGKILLDGGYSRFYDPARSAEVWQFLLKYLTQ